LGKFVTWCTENRNVATVDAITAAVVRAYLVHEQGRGLSPWTVHGAARAIRAFLRFCADDGLIDAAPKFSMPKLPKETLPAFDPADVARLLDACEVTRDKLIVLTLLDTGLRAAELVALDGRDIDPATGAVNVRQGKGRKDRTVYLGTRTRRELARYWREVGKPLDHAPVWASLSTGQRLTASGLRQLLQRMGERANVPNVHPHRFRRTFALLCLRAGMDVFVLARLMGHADIAILRPYLAIARQDLKAAHAQHSPVDRMK